MAVRPSRPAQRPAHQRHAVPDPRHRRRRQERSRHGARFPAADSGRPHRQGEAVRSRCPRCRPTDKEHPYELENGDSIAFVNLSGNKDRHEILVKDRYTHFWIFNNKLELLWKGDGQTGHYPVSRRSQRHRQGFAVHRLRHVESRGQAALEQGRADQGSRRRRDGRQSFRRSQGAAARLRERQRRRFPHVRPRRQDPQARPRGPQPEPQRRQVPAGPAGPAVHVGELLEESRHRHAVRRRRQHPGAGGADPHAAAPCCR